MRAVVGDAVVGLIWDNLSEITPDPVTLKIDFEGYQVWRADDWHRPLGTTVASGPSDDLWHLLDSRDLLNDIEPNVDLEKPWFEGGFQYEPLQQVENRAILLKAFEENIYYDPVGTVPCPPGVTEAECDTLEALARWNLGYDGGRRYYRYIDHDVKNGLPYFYAVVAYEPLYSMGKPKGMGRVDTPYGNFLYAMPRSSAQEAEEFVETDVYVVPNPVTTRKDGAVGVRAEQRGSFGREGRIQEPPEVREHRAHIHRLGGSRADPSTRRERRQRHARMEPRLAKRPDRHERRVSFQRRAG